MKLIKKIFIALILIVVLIVGRNILIEAARHTKRSGKKARMQNNFL